MATSHEEVKTNIFAMLNLPGLDDHGNLQTALGAPAPARQNALRIITLIRGIWEDAWQFTAAPGLVGTDTVAEMEIESSAYEHLCTLFEGTANEPGYGFLFNIEERGHDRLVEKLRRQVAGGYLRTIDLCTVYAQNQSPKIVEVMKKERLGATYLTGKDDFKKRITVLWNTYAFVGSQRDASGRRFLELQAARDLLSFYDRRMEAMPFLSIPQLKKADFDCRAILTEFVNSKRGNLSDAIAASWNRMLEAWNVAQANFIQSQTSSLQRTSTRRPFPANGEGNGRG